MTLPDESRNWEKSRNLELVGASTTEWQLITPRGGPCRVTPIWYRVKRLTWMLKLFRSHLGFYQKLIYLADNSKIIIEYFKNLIKF